MGLQDMNTHKLSLCDRRSSDPFPKVKSSKNNLKVYFSFHPVISGLDPSGSQSNNAAASCGISPNRKQEVHFSPVSSPIWRTQEFLCPLLCKNGGLCLQKDRCLCPANFTGKFCQIPVSHLAARSGDANEVVKPLLLSATAANQELMGSEFLLPLGQSRAVPRSPLPGLRSREVCCRGGGKAWGLTDCTLCPETPGRSNNSCPVGFQQSANGSQCVDVNECHQPGLCENGLCVNTMGSYSCVCRLGFILDATHGICISQSVISEEKGQCYRVVGAGLGPSSCSLPIARNITKQICCCSRVGKAWGPDCQRCPYFGSVTFKEICPAGPGYHYSASTLQFTQRADAEQDNTVYWSQMSRPPMPLTTTRPSFSGSPSSTRPNSPQPGLNAGSSSSRLAQPASWGTRTSQERLDSQQGRPNQPAARPQLFSIVRSVCQSRPGVCGRGRCLDQPGGKYTCECEEGYQLNDQGTLCHGGKIGFTTIACQQNPCTNGRCENTAGSYRCACHRGYRLIGNTCEDEDECRQNPCSNGRCENIAGSYRCVCHRGYRLSGNTCEDVDECVDPLQCPGQECINTLGSYRCSSCHAGFGLLNGICTDIDECRRSPCSNGRCENTPGSFRCVCLNGYRLKNNTCTDVDECAEPSQCPGQMCVNSVGSYRCVSCRQGYTLTNRQCTDVDECASAGACEAEQVCVNTVGSFRCDCRPGYRRFSLGGQCRDVNECLEGDFCFSRGECVNTPGSYTCVCSPGFTLNENRTACLDVDECMRSGVCSDGRCVNTEGSFQCQCKTGFITNPEKTACLESLIGLFSAAQMMDLRLLMGAHMTWLCFHLSDEDECVSQPGVCGSARCENTKGSFMCKCDGAADIFDSLTRQCVSSVGTGNKHKSHILQQTYPREILEKEFGLLRNKYSLYAKNL
uniref:Latent-transforming growth factor beta-binding protein 1-like n=1 Tax=Cyprinodon variegatus TaxID=28743 RepID=A0A3Q2CWD9_CYPVA